MLWNNARDVDSLFGTSAQLFFPSDITLFFAGGHLFRKMKCSLKKCQKLYTRPLYVVCCIRLRLMTWLLAVPSAAISMPPISRCAAPNCSNVQILTVQASGQQTRNGNGFQLRSWLICCFALRSSAVSCLTPDRLFPLPP